MTAAIISAPTTAALIPGADVHHSQHPTVIVLTDNRSLLRIMMDLCTTRGSGAAAVELGGAGAVRGRPHRRSAGMPVPAPITTPYSLPQ